MIYNLFGDVTPKLLTDIKQLIEDNPNDNELLINIDTYGGDLSTAFSLADYLRSIPTLNVKTHIQGNCMSAGTIIALIAPLKNRSATKHSVFMCHSPLTETMGLQDTETISCLADTMKGALKELEDMYCERTNLTREGVQSLVGSKREFYASEALNMGFISSIDALYNKGYIYNKQKNTIRRMKKSFLTMLTNKIVKALLYNEVYTAEDGTDLEIDVLEVGGKCSQDGIFVVNGYTITVENGVITDIIAPQEEVVENEGEDKTQEEKVEEVAETVQEVVEKTVEQTVEEDGEVDATEVGKVVKEIVEESLKEFDELKELVEKCGGKDKLKALCNVKHSAKVFNSVEKKDNNKKYTIKELVEMKRNRK